MGWGAVRLTKAFSVLRVFSSKSLHYIASLSRPYFLGVDVAAGQDPRGGVVLPQRKFFFK